MKKCVVVCESNPHRFRPKNDNKNSHTHWINRLCDRTAQDASLVKERMADGIRAMSFTVRDPQAVFGYFQVLKQVKERHANAEAVTASVDDVSTLLRKSDSDIREYIAQKMTEMQYSLNAKATGAEAAETSRTEDAEN